MPDVPAHNLDEAREQQSEAKKTHREQIEAEFRGLIERRGLTYPVRIRMGPMPNEGAAPPEEVRDCKNGVFLVRSENEKRFHKVQKMRERWTCDCSKWRKNRGIDCQHVDKARARSDGRGMPYANARRRPPTRILYRQGTLTEGTRRKNAYAEWPTRCPEIFEELCAQIEEPPVENPRGGAPAIGLRVATYITLMKAHLACTYAQLAHHLASDPAIQRLGWMKVKAISLSSLCKVTAHPQMTDELRKMVATIAHTAHRIEDTAIIDASGLPNSLAANWNEEKYGGRRKRKGRTYLKPTWVTGGITNLIAYLDLTLDYGLGAGDAPHYRDAVRETKKVWPSVKRILGDGSYGPKGNYLASERFRVELINRERSHERRKKWGGQAARVAEMQHQDIEEFREIYRFRSRGETPPSRIKRHQSYQRARRRVTDTVVPQATRPDEVLCELPDEELAEILDGARAAVGRAQANEAFAQVVAGNVREVIMLEHLHDERMCLAAGSAFIPITTVTEAYLRAS